MKSYLVVFSNPIIANGFMRVLFVYEYNYPKSLPFLAKNLQIRSLVASSSSPLELDQIFIFDLIIYFLHIMIFLFLFLSILFYKRFYFFFFFYNFNIVYHLNLSASQNKTQRFEPRINERRSVSLFCKADKRLKLNYLLFCVLNFIIDTN